jgi:hypothetical protein
MRYVETVGRLRDTAVCKQATHPRTFYHAVGIGIDVDDDEMAARLLPSVFPPPQLQETRLSSFLS